MAEHVGVTDPDPFRGSKGWVARYGDQEVSQFRAAEMIAEKWDISREDMEAFAFESHQRAIRAIDEGRFEAEIEPLEGVEHDEGPRRESTLEKMADAAHARRGRPADRRRLVADLGQLGRRC